MNDLYEIFGIETDEELVNRYKEKGENGEES